MSEALGLVIDSNTTTTVLAIVAAALSFVIALLVFLCNQPLLDPSFEVDTKSSRGRGLERGR
jgi:hypothetical protein